MPNHDQSTQTTPRRWQVESSGNTELMLALIRVWTTNPVGFARG